MGKSEETSRLGEVGISKETDAWLALERAGEGEPCGRRVEDLTKGEIVVFRVGDVLGDGR